MFRCHDYGSVQNGWDEGVINRVVILIIDSTILVIMVNVLIAKSGEFKPASADGRFEEGGEGDREIIFRFGLVWCRHLGDCSTV